ncbi:MAG: BadF/BadG/BcrA/BcrD ATPase family protein [Pseudolysinimonas sp.]
MSGERPLVVAVDGGGSKTDAVALELDGAVVARASGPGSSPHFEGLEDSVATIDALVREVAGGRPVAHAAVYLSGLDLPHEVSAFAEAVAAHNWAGPSTVVENDLWALLRTGTESPDAVAVICGTGINAIGVSAEGRVVRFAALGPISGDWGGGSGLGEEALWHAARDEDGRGPKTTLRDAVLRGMHVASVAELSVDLHTGRRSTAELAVLAPAVLEAARGGDATAIRVVDRQADEIVTFVTASLSRLGLEDRAIPVVLGGGLIRSGDARLLDGVRRGLAERAPHTEAVIVDDPPIVGAALLALEATGADAGAVARARTALSGP